MRCVFFFKVLRFPKKIMQDNINRIENYFPTIILFLRQMTQIDLSDRKRPIEQYLNRQQSNITELQFLKSRTINYFFKSLNSDNQRGLTDETAAENQRLYGKNQLAKKRLKSFCELFCHTLQDLMLQILIASAIISIVVQAIYSEDRSTFWLQGVTILAAVAVCSIVASVNDYQKQKQFESLNEISEQNNKFDIFRNGVLKEVCKDQIVVGDIIRLIAGLQIPVDGLITQANDIIVDESSMTGESHQLYKNVLERCVLHGTSDKKSPSPVLISGSKIMSGEGKMLCLLVGKDHRQGQLNQKIQEENDDCTPLEQKLEDLAEKIGLFGLFSGVIMFVILVIWLFFSQILPLGWNSSVHINAILGYLMLAVVIIVVAVPEGLPLAVTLSLAFSVKQMLKQNNLVKQLSCCETMGSAHVICTDKTGTLTQNDMFVVQIWNGSPFGSTDFATAPFINHKLNQAYKELVYTSIAVNSSAVLEPKLKGSPTEIALLRYAKDINPHKNLLQERKRLQKKIFIRLPFNSDRKRLTTGINIDGVNFLFLTGASEIVLQSCSSLYDVKNKVTGKGPINRTELQNQIDDLTRRGLRVVGLAVKEIKGQIPDAENISRDQFGVRDIQKNDFSLLMLAAIQDLPRPESKEAIRQCNRAGVVVIMVTGDSSITARSIADELGITKPGDQTPGLMMEGNQFEKLQKNLAPEVFYEKVKHLKVLARSRPEHKYRLVEGLKKINNIVAVTGDGTNDAPALLKADVGVAMGISGTQVAKNAADILILDDNFNSIVRSIVWGRNIYDSVKKFLQFQLTVNGVACIISIISSAVFKQSVFTTVQMLWVNMIMDSLASLALSTESPNTEQLLSRQPVKRTDSLITSTMIKHIVGQCIYQITLLMFLIMKGQDFLPEYKDEYDTLIGSDLSAKYHNGQSEGTMTNGLYHPLGGGYSYQPYFQKYHIYSRHLTFVFNVFVFLQIFNFFNCRKIYDEFNLLSGLFTNYIFWIMLVFITFFQFAIIYFLNIYFKCYNFHGLTSQHWLLSVLLGATVIPLSLILRALPIAKPKKQNQVTDEANDLMFHQPEEEQCKKCENDHEGIHEVK